MEHKYQEGEIVYDKMRPLQKLTIKKFFKGIYYCSVEENPKGKGLVYFERELFSDIEKRSRRSI